MITTDKDGLEVEMSLYIDQDQVEIDSAYYLETGIEVDRDTREWLMENRYAEIQDEWDDFLKGIDDCEY